IGVSADSEKMHERFREKHQLPYPLIADEEKELIQAYGVWGPKVFMGKKFDGINRTTFIIDEAGKIRNVIAKVKTKEHAEQIFELIK
ncbi:MAG TPA: peroxiredoxin, partial [Flavobacteriales bacterium]|nr:peroxiredoxin [Flavobacteriales bacterium]